MGEKLILILNTTHQTMQVEKILKKNMVRHNLIHKPMKINPGCGIAISIFKEDKEIVKKLLEDGNIQYEGIYCIEGDEFKGL